MRLYWLNSRVGAKTKGLTPWFRAPVPGAPVRYDGWVWDPAVKEWVKTRISKIEIEVEVPRYPKPLEDPRPAQPIYVPGWYWYGRPQVWSEIPLTFQELSDGLERGPMPKYPPGPPGPGEVEGWSWSETTSQWVATILVAEKVGFTPPRSFPPMVDRAAVHLVMSMTEQHAIFIKSLIDMGLTQTEAKRIGSAMVDGFWNMSRSAITKHRAVLYADSFLPKAVAQSDKLEALGVYGAIIALTVIVGLLIGSIMERLAFPEDEFWPQFEPAGTYLMGPDNWVYSRFIGRSAEGQPYYSVCEGIGTEFVRHKRGVSKGDEDIIDFPGGFLETGYAFPWFVKFVWRFWTLEYIGMLEPIGGDWYVLKKGNSDPYARGRVGVIKPRAQWCEDFHWYL